MTKKKNIILALLVASASLFGADKVFSPKGIAIKGYDTVAYFVAGEAQKGSANFTYKHQGHTWHFANKANLEAFKKDPNKYMPQYGGFCAYGLGKGGYLAPINPKAFSVYNGKLYLNYDKNIAKKWQKKKDHFIEKANKAWLKKK